MQLIPVRFLMVDVHRDAGPTAQGYPAVIATMDTLGAQTR